MDSARWKRRVRLAAAGFAAACLLSPLFAGAAAEGRLDRRTVGPTTRLVYTSAAGRESLVATTDAVVSNERAVLVPDAAVLFAAWDERGQAGQRHFVSVSLDQGESWKRPQALTFDIPLKSGRLTPGAAAPAVPDELRAGPDDRLFIVQFETGGVTAFRRLVERLGAEVLAYLPEHAHVVRMSPGLVATVAAQPFVRWVGRYEPGYKIEPAVLTEIGGRGPGVARRYHLQTFTPGLAEKTLLAREVEAAGGSVDLLTANGYRMDATLTLGQVVRIAHSNHLLWLDRWSEPENDMDIVRAQDGADYIETVAGYRGQGVSGEVMDDGVMQSHQDFDGIRIHGSAPSSGSHGTCTYGIVFGNGARDGDGSAQATGNLPAAQGWFFDYNNLTDRYQSTADLLQAPIFASFQSNSWGSALTTSYTSVSFEMDDIIWLYDIPIFQSQSNAGSRSSRPQAWAKNIFSIGAVNHYNTATLTDDCWCSTASIGPAEDGRIKPDLAFWYDWEYTTDLEPGGYATGPYYDGFGGTSGATPITAGISGLFAQMWADNILGNNPQGSTVFEKRPHSSTMKALMVNTAEQYPFTGTTSDMTRVHQGWGLPSARRFYDRAPLMHVIDEENVLEEFDTHTYTATVPAGQGELKVTLVYTDRAGTTSSTLHRINDVTLKMTDPGGATTWWGNYGLDAGNWSQPAGAADTKNTVENIFIQNPAPGAWTIEITADDLNQDQHAETPEVDQDYALVVYGASALDFGCAAPPPAPTALTADPSGENRVNLAWTGTPTARRYRVFRSVGGCAGTYVLIGTVPREQTTFVDTNASGGSVYGYVVRAVEACESLDSNCASTTATGPCLLAPSFGGLASAAGDNASTCGATLTWAPATPHCGGPVVYNVYRAATTGFTPSNDNRIAACVSSTTHHDVRNLGSGQTRFYIVRAEDLGGRGSTVCGGAPEANTIVRSALTQGPTAPLFDSGFETGLEGWVPAPGALGALKGDFIAGTPTGSFVNGAPAEPSACAAGTQCLYTMLNKGGNPDQGDVDGGEVLASSPLFDASGFTTARVTLSRWHFNSATTADSGDHFALDVSNDNGLTWSTMENLTGLASPNSWTTVSYELSGFRPLSSQMKIRVRSADGPSVDTTVESAIDAVHIEGAQTCATQSAGAPGDVGAGSLRVERAGSRLRLSWTADCGGAVQYGVYRGDLAAGYASLAPVAGYCGIGATTAEVAPGAGSHFYLVSPNDGSTEGLLGRTSGGVPRSQPAQRCYPRATPVNTCAP